MPNAVQSEIYVGNLMDISMTNPDFFALKLGNQILRESNWKIIYEFKRG